MSEADGYLCPQRMSDGASLREEKVCPDCPMTKNRPERGLERLLEFSIMFNRSTSPHTSLRVHVSLTMASHRKNGRTWYAVSVNTTNPCARLPPITAYPTKPSGVSFEPLATAEQDKLLSFPSACHGGHSCEM